jgi:cell division protein FtsQ
MASSSNRRYGSSGRSSSRNRVVIGAQETTRVHYSDDRPQVASERKNQRAEKRQPAKQSERPPKEKRAKQPPARPAKRSVSAGARVANQRRDERDRRRRQIDRRRSAIAVGLVVVVLLAAWGLVKLWNAPLFAVKSVKVNGTVHLKPDDVIALAAVPPDATLLRLPSAQILGRVDASPWVAQARLVRKFPDTLEIDVVERTPVAIVDAGPAGQWLVSSDRHWIIAKGSEPTGTLMPVRDVPGLKPLPGQPVNSAELTNALGVLAGLSDQLRAQGKYVSAQTVEKTMLVLKNDVQVFFGPAEDMSRKDLIARAILGKEKNVVYVNVRVTDRPTWRGLTTGN